ncbi:DNA polymerase III subunit chi [Orbaceae bacterium ESL0721]|nr:DNA polymerase III subunit chi [Orbaceae bacterium ESL0721]
MIKKAIFYLIENEDENKNQSDKGLVFAHEKLACEKIVEAWQARTRLLVACQDQAQAERIDEYLWQLDTDNFVPHNLVGEGLKGGSAVEICWRDKRGHTNRPLLINLQESFPDFATLFQDVIDFVPADEHLKSLARERYKAYKTVGFMLKTVTS